MTHLTKKTFEDLVDEIGLAQIFQGTDADQVTQNLVLEWFFDCKLLGDTDEQFLRYFRRRFNNLFPRYLDQIRVSTVMSNFDPFVTEYYEDIAEKIAESNGTSQKFGTTDGKGSTSLSKASGTTTIRTPDLVTSSEDTTIDQKTGSVINSGQDSTAHNAEESASKSGSDRTTRQGTDRTTHTGTETTTGSTTSRDDTTTKGDVIGISYPEANLNSLNIIADPEAGRQADYASTEELSASKATSNGSGTSNQTDTKNLTDTTNTNGSDVTTYGTTDERESTSQDVTTYGSRANSQDNATSQSTGTIKNTGSETTQTTNQGTDTSTTKNEGSTSEEATDSHEEKGNEYSEHKGRHESVADILPRAIKAIQENDQLKWFRDSMLVCFNCTSL